MAIKRTKIKNRNTTKDYINNEKLLEEVKIYLERLKLAKLHDTKLPQMPNYIGECFIKISENFANNYTFRNYPMKDEMIADGVYFCVKALDSFDVNRTNNPFAFFTQAVYFAFLQRIEKEKKYLYTKYKSIENSHISQQMAEHQEHDDTIVDGMPFSSESRDVMSDFIRNYEDNIQRRKDKKKNTTSEEDSE